MLRNVARILFFGFAIMLIVFGCGPLADPKDSVASRARYAEQLVAIKERNDRLGTEVERDLKTVLEDPKLSQEQKSKKVVEQFGRMILSIRSDQATLNGIVPPADLTPLHQFYVSDLSTNQSIYTDLRDSIQAQDQGRISAVLERFNAYDLDRKNKLSNAYRDSSLEPGDSLAAFKKAIAQPRPGPGVWWAGLPINTWLIIGWFVLACISTSNKRIWQAAKRGDLPPGDEEPPGYLANIVVVQYGMLAVLLYFNWQQALSVFVITFLIASFLSFIMELIGTVLMIPFVIFHKAVRGR